MRAERGNSHRHRQIQSRKKADHLFPYQKSRTLGGKHEGLWNVMDIMNIACDGDPTIIHKKSVNEWSQSVAQFLDMLSPNWPKTQSFAMWSKYVGSVWWFSDIFHTPASWQLGFHWHSNSNPSFKLQAYTLQTLLHLHGATVQIQLVPTWKRRSRRLCSNSSRGFVEKTWVGRFLIWPFKMESVEEVVLPSMPLDKA